MTPLHRATSRCATGGLTVQFPRLQRPKDCCRFRPWHLVIDTTRIDSEDSSRLQRRSRHFAPFHECVGSSFLSQPPSELSRQQGQRFADRGWHSSSPIPPGQGSDPDLFPSGHTALFAYLKGEGFLCNEQLGSRTIYKGLRDEIPMK